MKRKTVDVQVEYLPEEKIKTPSPHNTLKFSRQVSLPANQMSSRFFRQRMNSMPGDSASGKKNGRFHLTLWFVDPVNTLSQAFLNTIKRQTKNMDIYAWVESLLYSFIILMKTYRWHIKGRLYNFNIFCRLEEIGRWLRIWCRYICCHTERETGKSRA